MNWQQLNRSHTQRPDVFEDFVGKTFVSSSPLARQTGMKFGIPSQIELIDYRVVPRHGAPAGLSLPVEIRVDYDAFRNEGSAVSLVKGTVVAGFQLVAKHCRLPKWPRAYGSSNSLL